MINKSISVVIVQFITIGIVAFAVKLAEPKSLQEPFGRVEITLHFDKQDFVESNQFAVWIQNREGDVVKTLFVTQYTAQGGYAEDSNCLPRWRDRVDASSLTQEEMDSFSGATPKSGWHTYVWDGTDQEGNVLPKGNYIFAVEGTYNKQNRVLYMGLIPTRGGEITVEAQQEYFPRKNSIFGSGMVERVEATYIPAL